MLSRQVIVELGCFSTRDAALLLPCILDPQNLRSQVIRWQEASWVFAYDARFTREGLLNGFGIIFVIHAS